MKKLLLSLMLICAFAMTKAQVVLNEIYCEPGSGKSEFIELYNSSGAAENLDCYTILTYWSSGADKGWYVIDLPNDVIASKGWYVIAAANPFNVQAQTNVVPNANWNSLPASGYLKKYKVSGSTYTEIVAGTVTDLLVNGNFYTGANYMTMLFRNGVEINTFWGGGPSGTLPVGITSMPILTLTPTPGSCGASYIIDFTAIGAVEFHNPSGGSDNGYARLFDGKCGSWTKTSSSSTHTPGAMNGSAAGQAGSMTTTQSITCVSPTSFPYAVANFDITAISGDVTLLNDFPVKLVLYRDVDFSSTLNAADTIVGTKFINDVASPGDTIKFFASNAGSEDLIFVYETQRGCFDKVQPVTIACATLPVKLSLFTASRNRSDVNLVWETVTEENNAGYYIQRKVGAGDWQTVGFIASQAVNGNSNSLLHYEFVDNNPTKGMTQYRLRQVDIDGKTAYSQIRAVRGEDQSGSTIVYPNPSNDGNVNIVFENSNASRNVSVFDMNGRAIKQWRNVTNNIIRVENLTPGFYSVRIVNNDTGEQIVEKIIVNKR